MRKRKVSFAASPTLWALVGLVWLYCIGAWLANAVKLAECDFGPDYRCEIIHGIGVIVPPLSSVTAWVGGDARHNTHSE